MALRLDFFFKYPFTEFTTNRNTSVKSNRKEAFPKTNEQSPGVSVMQASTALQDLKALASTASVLGLALQLRSMSDLFLVRIDQNPSHLC